MAKTTKRVTRTKRASSTPRRNTRNSVMSSVANATSKGVGKYKAYAGIMSKRQINAREKQALSNEAKAINAKPEVIKALGQAFATNVAPSSTTYAATAGSAKIVEAQNKNQSINNLINGGVHQSGKDNDEELNEGIPGGVIIR